MTEDLITAGPLPDDFQPRLAFFQATAGVVPALLLWDD
jgi:hypothetical protein